MIRNLAQLKRTLTAGSRLEITAHWKTSCVGQVRRVTTANTTGFYSVVDGQPEHPVSQGNGGRGSVLWWGAASKWSFRDGVCTRFFDGGKERLMMAFRVLEKEAA